MASGYLQRSRHGTVFYFRRRVPTDLRHVVSTQQIYRSLGTTDRRVAVVRARALAAELDQLFDRLRSMPKNEKDATPLQVDFSFALNILPNGEIKTHVQIDPGDTPEIIEAGNKALANAILAAKGAAGGTATAVVPPSASTSAGPTLGEAVQRYLAQADLKSTSLKNYKSYLHKVALPFLGSDKPLAEIKQRDIAAFAEHIQTMGKSRSTMEGYLSALTAMGKWHRNRGTEVPVWSAEGLLPRDRTPAHTERAQHSLDDLGVIFKNAAQYLAREPERFWVTVVTAFTGCRVEEIAQINLATDFKQHETGVYYFTLNELPDEDGETLKAIKKAASWRAVPIHSALVRHGFVRFLEERRAEGFSRPFERLWRLRRMPLNIEGREDAELTKWAHVIIRWGSRELKAMIKAGELESVKGRSYFHSMRHTFATHLGSRGIPAEQRALLAGQSMPGENAERYTKSRDDPTFMSSLVEAHLDAYVELLDKALGKQA